MYVIKKNCWLLLGNVTCTKCYYVNYNCYRCTHDLLTFNLQLEMLAHALVASGRHDLAEELRERDMEFRRRRSASLRGRIIKA